MTTDTAGRPDRGGEAISGTSEAPGKKAIWHPELLSNTLPMQPTLDLITTRRKERHLTGRWRDKVCVSGCVSRREEGTSGRGTREVTMERFRRRWARDGGEQVTTQTAANDSAGALLFLF